MKKTALEVMGNGSYLISNIMLIKYIAKQSNGNTIFKSNGSSNWLLCNVIDLNLINIHVSAGDPR